MPLLKQWQTTLASGDLPASREPRPLTRDALPGIDWNEAPIYSLQAKFNPDRTQAVARVAFSKTDTELVTRGMLYLLRDRQVSSRVWNPGEQGRMDLLDCGGPITAITGPDYGQDFDRKTVQPAGKVVFIKSDEHSGGIGIEAASGPVPCAEHQYVRLYNLDAKALFVYNNLTGRHVATVPSGKNTRSAVREVDNGLLVAGTESIGQNKGLFWHTLPKGSKEWKTTRLPITDSYIKDLLPKSLRLLKMDLMEESPVQNLPAALGAGGSIVFSFSVDFSDGDDRLSYAAIVEQPREGQPRLLTWEVYHHYEPKLVDDPEENRRKSQASRTFCHVWFPDSEGKVQRSYFSGSWRYELTFDVDIRNNSVFFLRQGRLFALDLNQ